MYKFILFYFVICLPFSSLAHDVYKQLESRKKLNSINWKEPQRSFLNKLNNYTGQSDFNQTILKYESNISFAGINFDKAKVFTSDRNKQYKFVLSVDSANKNICEQSHKRLVKIYGKESVLNDRTLLLKDVTAEWTFGNTMIHSWCFGPHEYWKDDSKIMYALVFSDLNGMDKEIPMQIINCKVDQESADYPRKEFFNLIFKIDEKRKTLLDTRNNGVWANNLVIDDYHIEFKKDLSTNTYQSVANFQIDRYSGRIIGSNEIIQKNNNGKLHIPNIKIRYVGECKKIDVLEKKF